MELACVMSKHRFDATLVFMAVAGEEQGLLGATGYAKSGPREEREHCRHDHQRHRRQHARAGRHGGSLAAAPLAQGVPAVKTLPDDVVAALRTSGENDLPTRQLARRIQEAATQYVKDFKVEVIWRRDRFLRGGDHFPFLEEGYPAIRFTEPVEDWRHQHQDVRVQDGVQFGDLPDFVDFGYVANVARVNAAAAGDPGLAPSAPPRWRWRTSASRATRRCAGRPNPEPDVAATASSGATRRATWQHMKDVGNVTRFTLPGLSKDNFSFGLQAYDKDGYVSGELRIRSRIGHCRPWRGHEVSVAAAPRRRPYSRGCFPTQRPCASRRRPRFVRFIFGAPTFLSANTRRDSSNTAFVSSRCSGGSRRGRSSLCVRENNSGR
jgi:hypothetical protein